MLREVGDLEVVAALTASRIVTADFGHHGRLAGGPGVGMASVIDVGTVMLRRERPGGRCGASVDPASGTAGAAASRTRQPRVQLAGSGF